MRVVTMIAQVDQVACIGCKICQKICPTLAIKVVERKARVDPELCFSCGNCNQRCPENAIKMVKREQPFTVFVNPEQVDKKAIEEICERAKMNPEQLACYCTETRVKEVAAAIILGADTPEKISQKTGIRTGCKVECIQPALRLLEAAGITPEKPEGYQWYGRTPTIWDIPKEVKDLYTGRGFYFQADIDLLERIARQKENQEGEK